MKINDICIHANTNNVLKIKKIFNTVAVCLYVEKPTKIFWFKEIENTCIVKLSNLKKIGLASNSFQFSLFNS